MVHNHSSCLRVFAIPELAEIIFGQLPTADDFKLLLVCRSLFQYICPLVWEHTDAIFPLVSMIPDTDLVQRSNGALPPARTLKLPSTIDISRLRVYSPYIKWLDIPIAGHPGGLTYCDNWDGFLACTRSTILLPKLGHIRLTPPKEDKDQLVLPDFLKWAAAFLSPSLTQFCCCLDSMSTFDLDDPKFPWINLEDAQIFLEEISQRCPQLTLLELYPGNPSPTTQHTNHTWPFHNQAKLPIQFSPAPEFAPIYQRLNNLTRLKISPLIFDQDVFWAVALLPSLESLQIHGLRRDPTAYGTDLALPDSGFQALRSLELWNLAGRTVLNLIHQHSICRGLRELCIQAFTPPFVCARSGRKLFGKVISLLARHLPPTPSLSLSSDKPQAITPQMIDGLSHLPLVKLQLGPFDGNRSKLGELFSRVPTLETLDIDSNFWYSPMELPVIIGSLPRLRQLSLNMLYKFDENYHLCPSPVVFTDSFLFEACIDLVKPKRESAETVARFLYALTPNIRFSSLLRGGSADGSTSQTWEEDEDMINQALSVLKAGQ